MNLTEIPIELTEISIESYRIDCNSVQISSNQFKKRVYSEFDWNLYWFDCKMTQNKVKIEVSFGSQYKTSIKSVQNGSKWSKVLEFHKK